MEESHLDLAEKTKTSLHAAKQQDQVASAHKKQKQDWFANMRSARAQFQQIFWKVLW